MSYWEPKREWLQSFNINKFSKNEVCCKINCSYQNVNFWNSLILKFNDDWIVLIWVSTIKDQSDSCPSSNNTFFCIFSCPIMIIIRNIIVSKILFYHDCSFCNCFLMISISKMESKLFEVVFHFPRFICAFNKLNDFWYRISFPKCKHFNSFCLSFWNHFWQSS